MDIIFIEQLTVMAIIGVYEWEQKCYQKLVFDIELGLENNKTTYSDNSKNFLNYSEVSEVVLNFVKSRSFMLLELLAEEVAQKLLDKFRIPWLRIKVKKPGAIIQAVNVGVIIERYQKIISNN